MHQIYIMGFVGGDTMGMYMKNKTEEYKIRFTPEQADYIERLAKNLDCTKSQAIRIIVDISPQVA